MRPTHGAYDKARGMSCPAARAGMGFADVPMSGHVPDTVWSGFLTTAANVLVHVIRKGNAGG